MKLALKMFTAVGALFALVACGGGGGGSYSTGGVYYTHEQLASEFVRRVNVDVAGYNLSLMKANTLQQDYIVVYDWIYGTYDAYWLGGYSVGQNLYNYLINNDKYFYYDLIPMSGNLYKDYYTGVLFNKVEGPVADLGDLKALAARSAIKNKANELRAEYGMSKKAAEKIASFAYNLKAAPAGTYSTKDFDKFTESVFGSTITEIQNDYKNGDSLSLAKRIQKAGEVSGMGADGASALVQEVFFSQK